MSIFSNKFLALTLLVSLFVSSHCLDEELDKESVKKSNNVHEWKLPNSLLPYKYDLTISKVDFKDSSFKGIIEIHTEVEESTKEIILHCGEKIKFSTLSVWNSKDPGVPLELDGATVRNSTTEKLAIYLKSELKVTDKIVIYLDFEGKLRDDMTGFYKSSYLLNDKEVFLAATQFEAISARHAFPCFDEPEFKAVFEINIVSEEGQGCLSNMPQIKNEKCHFEPTEKMSTYLVAFVVTEDEASFNFDKSNSKVSVWSRKVTSKHREHSRVIAEKSLAFFEETLKQKYSLPKLDLVAVPDFSAGAMENWGLMTFRESNLLVDEEHSTTANKQQVSMVVAHEVAHNWFGNLVTPKAWDYLWLSEAFARYWQYMAVNTIEEKWKMEDQFVVDIHQAAYDVDSVENSKPMTRKAENSSDINSMGDMICYNKGASVMRMMEHAFGHNNFITALRTYLDKNKLKNTEPGDLWKALQAEVDKNDPKLKVKVSDVMNSWTTQAGFPYVTVTVNETHINFKQERFFIRNPNKVSSDAKWIIPIRMSNSKAADESVIWMTEKELTVKNGNKDLKWFLLNNNSAGFYRVKYDKKSLEEIFNVLKNDHKKIDPVNRAALIDDLLNLARADLLDYSTVFKGLKYIRKEKDYLPIKSAFNALDYLLKKFADTLGQKSFEDYLVSLFTDVYYELGFEDKEKDDHFTVLLRQELNKRMCNFGYTECIVKSQKNFINWMNGKQMIPKNQRSTAYCTAIKYGTQKEWDFLWKHYQSSESAAEQTVILSALGCTSDKKLLKQYLLDAITKSFKESRIRKQDFKTVFGGIQGSSPDNAEFVIDFVKENIEKLKSKLTEDEISGLISGSLKNYPSIKLIYKAEKSMEEIKIKLEKIKSSLDLANYEVKWFDGHSSYISKYVENEKEITSVAKYRLPLDVLPESYVIHVTPDITDISFKGTVEIVANVTNATDKITFHSDQLKFTEKNVIVTNDKKPLKVYSVRFEEKYHLVHIELQDKVLANTKLTIKIQDYQGILNSEMKGFYISYYKTEKNKTRGLAASHLEPVGARRMFPCFDEPALKATFEISATVPKGYHAVSNMDVKESKETEFKFKTTVQMSTYLVALVVSDFESKTTGNTTKRPYTVYSSKIGKHQLNYSLELMDPIVNYYEKNLRIEYTLPKLDMVALPDFSAGAMENWGLLTYRETGMLFDEKTMSTLNAKQSIRNVIAHEIAHQWFGNLVTPDWWSHIWLSEGFARYFQFFAHTKTEDSWDLENQFVVDVLQTSMVTDATTSTHPISNEEVNTPKEIKDMFDAISYSKGGSIIRMIQNLVGEKKFFSALSSYLKECSYGQGTPEKLYEHFQKQLKKDEKDYFVVEEIWGNWVTQAGFPVVNAVFEGSKVKLSQSRFFLRPSKATPDNQIWHIPITYISKTNPKGENVDWMNTKVKDMKITEAEKDWVILNANQIGYYRVNYDPPMWKKIINALNSPVDRKSIPVANRAAIIDDLMSFARAGQVDYDTVMSALSYLKNETDYIPWKAFFNNLPYLTKRLEDRPEIYDLYKKQLISVLEPSFKNLGFIEKKDEPHTAVFLRKLVLDWLCKLGHEGCVKKAMDLFEKELNNQMVPVSQRSWAYCTGIRMKDVETNGEITKPFRDMFLKMSSSLFATEKATILNSLACSKNKKSLQMVLRTAIVSKSTTIRFQDAKTVLTSIINSGAAGLEATMEFIDSNYKEIIENFNEILKDPNSSEAMVQNFITTIAKRVSTADQFRKLQAFLQNMSKVMTNLAKTISAAETRASSEIKWYEDNGGKIFAGLRKQIPVTSYFLDPTIARPTHYDIEMVPQLEKSFEFHGKVIIDIDVAKDTWEINLHSKDLVIDSIKSDVSAKYPVETQILNTKYEQLTISFAKLIPAKTKIQLEIKFKGVHNDEMQGFYKSSYVVNGKKRWLATTHFEPTHTRRAFPCFDEPIFKATFKMHIQKPEGYATLSNMAYTRSTTKDKDNKWWDHYDTSVRMAPYVLAFVVSDFAHIPENTSNSTVTVWARDQLKGYMNEAVMLGQNTLKFLNGYTLMPYPLHEMNLVAIPDFAAGAMENWGLVTFREYGLSYNESTISASYKRYVVTTVAHELVHMWFGNLVTCEKWDYTWLNEGFADYLAYLVSEKLKPEWQLLKQFVVLDLHTALNEDQSDTSHPMNNKITTPAEAAAGFDTIAYKKAGSILRMLRDSFGHQFFQEAIHEYLWKHKYNTARSEHLVEAFQERANFYRTLPGGLEAKEVTSVMNSWIEHAGYPLITARRAANSVSLTQERFLTSNNATLKKKWYKVPITYTTSSLHNFEDTQPKFWLTEDYPKSFAIKPEDTWFILNIQQIGFYRVNYDNDNWKRLIDVLNSDKFETIGDLNRAQLIDDSFNLARAGIINYTIPLSLSKYLKRETSHLPWKAFFSATAYLSRRIDSGKNFTIKINNQDKTVKPLELYQKHVQTILSDEINKLGYREAMDKDTHLDQLNKDLLLTNACKYKHEGCKNNAKDYYRQAKTVTITPNIANAVYCTAMEEANEEEWQALWTKYETALLASDYITYIKALGCSKKPEILKKYLDRIFNENSAIRKQDESTALSSIYSSSKEGLETATEYFENNLEKLHKYYGNWEKVGSLFKSMAGYYNTDDQIQKLENLMKDKKAQEIKSSLESAIKTAKKNSEWYDKNSKQISEWLHGQYNSASIPALSMIFLVTLSLVHLFL